MVLLPPLSDCQGTQWTFRPPCWTCHPGPHTRQSRIKLINGIKMSSFDRSKICVECEKQAWGSRRSISVRVNPLGGRWPRSILYIHSTLCPVVAAPGPDSYEAERGARQPLSYCPPHTPRPNKPAGVSQGHLLREASLQTNKPWSWFCGCLQRPIDVFTRNTTSERFHRKWSQDKRSQDICSQDKCKQDKFKKTNAHNTNAQIYIYVVE